MKTNWLISIKLTVLTLLLFGIIYPLFITGSAMLLGPNGGAGELIVAGGKTVGFALIGQKFDDDRYFNGRPSAVDYNAAATGGSNKGPTNPDYLALVQARIDTFLLHNPSIRKEDIPADLITASGSGLDPHISSKAARIQVPRIAKMRGLQEAQVAQLVSDHIENPWLGLIGIERVHVLKLNVALDELSKK